MFEPKRLAAFAPFDDVDAVGIKKQCRLTGNRRTVGSFALPDAVDARQLVDVGAVVAANGQTFTATDRPSVGDRTDVSAADNWSPNIEKIT